MEETRKNEEPSVAAAQPSLAQAYKNAISRMEETRNEINQYFLEVLINNNGKELSEAKFAHETYINKLNEELANEQKLASKFLDHDQAQEVSEAISIVDEETTKSVAIESEAGRSETRKSSNLFNYLVLQILSNSNENRPFDLDDIFKAAVEFDPLTKRNSLNSTLNRWKNDKMWASWSNPNFRQITNSGKTELERLKPYVRKESEGLENVKCALKNVLDLEI